MLKNALFAAVAALATVVTAAPVLAKDVVVSYRDLDLATAKGQRTFSQRIDRAAKSVCDYDSEGRIPSHAAVACYHQARAKARTEMAAVIQGTRLGG
jgi:UrcA family protein